MIKLFIDTNVVIDTMDHARTPERKCSEDVINLSAFKDYFRLCISMKSIADISYLGCKLVGKERIKPVLKQEKRLSAEYETFVSNFILRKMCSK